MSVEIKKIIDREKSPHGISSLNPHIILYTTPVPPPPPHSGTIMSTTPARGGASIVYETPKKAASDSDLVSLLKDIEQESKDRRAQERRRGVAKLQHHWRCARALSLGADGAAGHSDAAAGSRGAAKTNNKRRFKFTSPEGESTRSLGCKRPKICEFKAKGELDESALHMGGLPDDPISDFEFSGDVSSSEYDSDETGERSSIVVTEWTECPDCGRRVEICGAQCPCDDTYEAAPTFPWEKDDDEEDKEN